MVADVNIPQVSESVVEGDVSLLNRTDYSDDSEDCENSKGGQCEEIQTCLDKDKRKGAYQLVKDLTSEKQDRSSIIQDRSGKYLTEDERFSADGQNITQKCTTMRVVVTTQY